MSFTKGFFFFLIQAIPAAQLYAQKPVQVSQNNSNPNETTIVINPKSPNFITGASNINNIYLSSDSGKTWTESIATSPLGIYGDPVLINDKNGKIYFAHLSADPKKTGYNGLDKIVVQYSDDNGKTFSAGVGVGFNNNKLQDKPWMSLDEFKGSPFAGNLYITWTEFDKYESRKPQDRSRIRFSKSADGGHTFSAAITVSDTTGDCIDSDNTLEGATTASLPDGTVCMVWAAFGKLWLDKSSDGGKTWGKDKAIGSQVGGWDMDVDHIYRTNGLPFLVTDQSQGKYKGRMYLLWGDKRLGDADLWLIFSDDAGDSWSSPLRLNDDTLENGRDQFLGHLTIDPTSGTIYSVFYDRRHSENNSFIDTYLAWSEDGGQTFRNRRLTKHSFAPPGKTTFFGDYNGIAAQHDVIIPLWTEYKGRLNLFCFTLQPATLLEPIVLDSTFDVYFDRIHAKLTLHHGDLINGTLEVRTWKLFKFLGRTREYLFETKNIEEGEIVFSIKKNRKCLVIIKIWSKGKTRLTTDTIRTSTEK